MDEGSDTDGTKTGRPRKRDGPKVPYDEIDRLLVHGEVVEAEAGGTTVVYPSYRTLGRRYGCAHSLIAQYSRKHNCMRRRREAQARVVAKADEKLVELRATAMALSKDDALQMIDEYLAGFGKALAEGRVRLDDPAHFDRLCRLKEFLQGGADSRQEIHAALSLEDIQARHARMLRASRQASAEERGEVIDALPAEEPEADDRLLPEDSPAAPAATAARQVPGQPGEASEIKVGVPAQASRPSGAGDQAADNRARAGGRAPHGANEAPTGPRTGPSPPAARSGAADAARAVPEPGAEPPEKVCAPPWPSSASLAGQDGDGHGHDGRPRSSAALRRPPDAGHDAGRDPVASSRVLPRPCGEGVGEGSRVSGEHAPHQDEPS